MKSLSRNSVIDGKKIEVSRKAVEKHRIKTPSIFQSTIELSGGNQQKTILGRWLLADLKLLILDEPTKGIDVGAKSEIYKMICELARSGLAIILISSELPEIINLCDRVIIMASGKIVGELGREELTEERILKLAMSES